MRAAAAITLGIAFLAIAAYACDATIPDLDESGAISLDGHLQSGAERVDAGGSLSNASAGVTFVATISAPPGVWTFSATADGALAVTPAAADGGVFVQTFQGYGAAGASFSVPLNVLAGAGVGTVHATVGSVSRDFSFDVAALAPDLQICAAGADGGCVVPVDAQPNDGGTTAECGARAETLNIDALGSFQAGNAITIRVAPSSSPQSSESWPCNLTASGPIVFTGINGEATSLTIPITAANPILFVPALLKGGGVATVTANIGAGPQRQLTVPVGAAPIYVSEVEFLDHQGLQAQNVVRVCAGRAQGVVNAALSFDAGILANSSAALQPAVSCPSGYAGQTTFLWTGFQTLAGWSLSYDSEPSMPTQVVPMLGTAVALTANASSTWTDVIGDASSSTTVAVAVVVTRNALGTECGADAGSEPVALTQVTVVLPPVASPNTVSFTTDLNGNGGFSFVVPSSTTTVSATLNAGGLVSTSVTLSR